MSLQKKVPHLRIPDHIFREYDIRGIVGHEFDQDFSYRLGRILVSYPEIPAGPFVVGRDVRLSGPKLQQSLIEGICDGGRDVLDIGISPTPLAYFAAFTCQVAGCIHVTASHNPPEYNGFKIMLGRHPMHGKDILRLRKRMHEPLSAPQGKTGTVSKVDLSDAYMVHVLKDCSLKHPLKIAIDAGNGPAGLLAAPLYRRLGCRVIELFCDPDGTFPHHHPDPSRDENLQELRKTVLDEGCDLGIAFDGDGDRIGVVDGKGRILRNDMLLLLLARSILKQHPGATIIGETKCSQLLYDDIRLHGGRAIMWRAGHSPIKAKMQETGALLAGEMTGHIFFADRYFGVDDAVYTGARLMQLIANAGQSLATLMDKLPASISTPEIRRYCPDEIKFRIVEEAIHHFRSMGYQIVDIDGLRLQFEHGWALLRASNTQPALVLRF
ncbi:MAG: phosphomannomutase/phosphoglucomutase, partial [Zetaproteobacteria bacterium]